MKKHLLFICVMLFSIYGFGQWSADPNVNTVIAAGVNSYNEPRSVSDGAGGVVTTFFENTYDNVTLTSTNSLYAQKISSAGMLQWSGIGIKLSTTANNITESMVVADGSGGVVSVWLEEAVYGSQQTQIFAQRVDNGGNIMWGPTGVAVNATTANYELADLIRDAAGNYVFSYSDNAIQKNFGQKISSSGVVQWGAVGTQLVDVGTLGNHTSALVNLDGTGYKFIWQEKYMIGAYEGARYFWQKLNADGTKNGVNFVIDDYVPNALVRHGIESLAPDGSGGFYFVSVGDNGAVAQLYLQHVLNDGTKAFNATPWGMEIDASIGEMMLEGGVNKLKYGVAAVADGSGGVVVGWTDTRAGVDGIYAQRFNVAGAKLWNASDLAIASGISIKNFYGELIKMNEEGDFMFWINQPSATFGDHIYMQKVSAAGVSQFVANGVLVSGRDTYKYGDMIVSGGRVVLVWVEYGMGGANKMYAQAVLSSGALAGVLPVNFASFNASYINGITKLTWTTATETNNDYFDIERSEDGVKFVVVGREKGAMNSNQLNAYSFTDLNAFTSAGFLYYRIKQVDKSGQFDYTDIKVVKVPTLTAFAVKSFPNPVTHKLNVNLGQDAKAATYLLNDVSGKAWLRGSLVNSQEIDVTRLPVGVYILSVKSGDQNYREKIIKY